MYLYEYMRVTSSARLDDDDLGFVQQRWAFLCAQMFVNVVDGELIWFLSFAVDSEDSSQFPVRHDDHQHTVRVFEFWMFRELNNGFINCL